MSEQKAYRQECPDDLCDYYHMLVGPDNFECILTEPEDRVWYRDLSNVVVRLNRQHSRISQLEAERDEADKQILWLIEKGNGFAVANKQLEAEGDGAKEALIKLLTMKGYAHAFAVGKDKMAVCHELNEMEKVIIAAVSEQDGTKLEPSRNQAECPECDGTGTISMVARLPKTDKDWKAFHAALSELEEKEKEWFVFLDENNEPRYCCEWDEGGWWLFYWHKDKKWVSLRKVSKEEVDSFPRNLSKEHQALYFPTASTEEE